ncbi:hypothetical protein GA0115240_15901, partial [Streptomyces sp. DvalAA-14]|uniref:hypothetical protein n=1 Tax=unclassified Streptomyces TaxID=2593676 RepID=UPI00081BC223
MTLGTTVAKQHAVFQFAGTAGQRVFTTLTTVGAADDAAAQLLSPTGAVLATSSKVWSFPGNVASLDTAALPATGQYTIVIAPETGLATYRAQVTSVPADLALTGSIGGAAVQLNFDKMGQNAAISFAGTSGVKVFTVVTVTHTSAPDTYTSFDASLLGPDGAELSGAFNYSGIGGIGATELPDTGTYKVVIDPADTLTGAVTVQLFAVPADTTVAAPVANKTYQGTVSYGQHIGFTFSGTAGQKILAEASIASSAGTTVDAWLISPSGSYLAYDDGGNITATLTTSGTYTYFVEPEGAEAGVVSATIHTVPPDATATATVGGPAVTVTTTTPGQGANVTFNATAGQQVLITCATNLVNTGGSTFTTFNLLGPTGTQVSSTYYCAPPVLFSRQTLSAAGTYKLQIIPPGTATGSVTIQVFSPPADPTAVATVDGPVVSVATTVPGQTATVTFQATAGQTVYLTCAGSSLSPSTGGFGYRWTDPSGATVGYDNNQCVPDTFIDTSTVTSTGVNTIKLTPTGVTTGTVTIQVHSVAATPTATATATVGGPAATVTTTVPGQKATITFTATANQRVYIACLKTLPLTSDSDQVQFSLLDPSGHAVGPGLGDLECYPPPTSTSHPVTLFDSETLTAAGTYTVTIDPPLMEFGSTTLQVYSVPPDATATATVGGPAVSVSTTAVGQNANITFNATANQRVFISGTQTEANANGGYTFYNMTDWSQAFFSFSYLDAPPTLYPTQVLPTTGTYTIAIDPPGIATGKFTIQIYLVPADATATATVGGGPVTMTTTVPGQQMSATFTATA